MHRVEAYNILAEYLAQITDHGECARRIESNRVEQFIVTGARGTEFRVHLQCYWAGKPGGRIRVEGTIEYPTGAGLMHLTQALIIEPQSPPPSDPSAPPELPPRQYGTE